LLAGVAIATPALNPPYLMNCTPKVRQKKSNF